MFMVPRDIAEVAATGAPEPSPGEAIWVRAHFGTGALWLALVPAGKAEGLRDVQERMRSSFESLRGEGATVRLADVRVYRPVD
jgi:hypothetical protein